MDLSLSLIEDVVPELHTTYRLRIRMLSLLLAEGPMGRKTMALRLDLTERRVRAETDVLDRQGLLEKLASGMVLTTKGEEAITLAHRLFRLETDIQVLERELADLLGIQSALIVNGVLGLNDGTEAKMAQALSTYLADHLDKGQQVIAVTGGSTVQAVVPHLSNRLLTDGRSFTVVSARGGMGDEAANQPNTISERLAQLLGGQSISLYAPESLNTATYQMLLKEPQINKTLQRLKEANVLIFSVGNADIMAKRRDLDAKACDFIKSKAAIGEAFGCFFDKEGKIVYRVPRIGIQIEDIHQVKWPILVAGGEVKADVITAFAKIAPQQLVLITDEGASHMVLNGAKLYWYKIVV